MPDYKIPYDKKGNQMLYASRADPNVDWRTPGTINGNLMVDGWLKTKHSSWVRLKNRMGLIRWMRMADFIGSCAAGDLQGPCLRGAWRYRKWGTNYGLYPVHSPRTLYPTEKGEERTWGITS